MYKLLIGFLSLCTALDASPALGSVPVSGGGKFHRSSRPVANEYLVVLKQPLSITDATNAAARATSAIDAVHSRHPGKIKRRFSPLFAGYSARMTEAQALALSKDSDVAWVEENGIASGSAVQANATWGLDRIDQFALPLSNSYQNYGLTGNGVTVYVIDSGIRLSHSEFGGRAYVGVDFVEDGLNGWDGHGHGTHVAGTVGGAIYGVAKQVKLCSVRVLGVQNTGTLDDVVAGITWAVANRSGPAVLNISLGSSLSPTFDKAVRDAVTAGVPTIVAAGNKAALSTAYSPGSVTEAIVVGATTSADARATFSNFGAGVDLFAPGQTIRSASYLNDTDSVLYDGTSMAAPHVAGLAALILQDKPSATHAEVEATLIRGASFDRLSNLGSGSPNRLARVVTTPVNLAEFGDLARLPGVKTLAGDFDNDGKSDLIQVGPGFTCLPVAYSSGNGEFVTRNDPSPDFGQWVRVPGAEPILGDFNGDKRADVALFGRTSWASIPVAFSTGRAPLNVTNVLSSSVEEFISWARVYSAQTLVGDFNGDGKTDIALFAKPWSSIPVAFSKGNGDFNVTNIVTSALGEFMGWAAAGNARVLPGDYNGDGKMDVALYSREWSSIPVAFSQGNGNFVVSNVLTPALRDFSQYGLANPRVTTGDFNGDGKTDILLVGGTGWYSIPIAFSLGNGDFNVVNTLSEPTRAFNAYTQAGRELYSGDYNADKKGDLFLSGGAGWTTLPVAASLGNGTFTVTNAGVGSFGTWAETGQPIRGDFNGDGRSDVALVAVNGVSTLPIAFSLTGGAFSITNKSVITPP